MPYKNKDKQREYQRLWMQRRRAKYLDGKVCEWCGSDEEITIHHINKSNKVSHKIWSWKEVRILEELSKCSFICSKCHIGHHAEENRQAEDDITHGTTSTYAYRKCRCGPCKAAKSKYDRAYREAQANR